MVAIGERIKTFRKEKNLTQADLAAQLNVSRSSVSNWEIGRNYPDLDLILTLSDILDVSLDQLLREDPVMVEEVSHEQKKNVSRKRWLRILMPLVLILSLFSVASVYGIYTNTHYLDGLIAKEQHFVAVVKDGEKDALLQDTQGKTAVVTFTGFHFKKEIVSDVSNPQTVTLKIFQQDTQKEIATVTLQPGQATTVTDLQRHVKYRVEIWAEPGTYNLSFN